MDDDKAASKTEEKEEDNVKEKEQVEFKNDNNSTSIKSHDDNTTTSIKSHDGAQRDRPKSVLKNKTPTPVITTSTTPNINIRHPHGDRECCNIL